MSNNIISKGSVLEEVTPYLVVPVYNNSTTSVASDAATTTTTTTTTSITPGNSRSIDRPTDPTRIPNLKELPGWDGCPVWDRDRSVTLLEKPEIQRFLRRARRTASSSSSDAAAASWRILCVLATIRVVGTNLRDEKGTAIDARQQSETKLSPRIESIQAGQDGNNDSPPRWWSVLVADNYDDENERRMYSGGGGDDDDDDDDCSGSLLVELWPLIRDHIPWKACQRLYLRIQNRLHISSVPHPLTKWAQKTIFELTDEEFETSWKVYQNQDGGLPIVGKRESDATSLPPNRLHASKLWLDRVANIPERYVGILIEDPLNIAKGKQQQEQQEQQQQRLLVSNGHGKTNNSNDGSGISSPALALPRCHQSCLPNTCIEISLPAVEEGIASSTESCNEPIKKRSNSIRSKWIALYDSTKTDSERRTLSTMPKSSKCDCFRCAYEETAGRDRAKRNGDGKPGAELIEITSTNLAQAQRLAHSYFQQEKFDEAMALYEKCHGYCKSSTLDPNETNSSQNGQSISRIEADLWHTMGAVLLSQRKFASAQQHWKNGSHYSNVHDELSHQLEKQEAYQYFRPESGCTPPNSSFSFETVRASEADSIHNATKAAARSVFIAPDVIDVFTCQNLIQWAIDYASNNGGWTTSRHYSVPTTDLPVHKVPKLLEWFQKWMPETLFPLLRDQFGKTRSGNETERFYVHDAFLVRYEATGSNCFLPLHFDESTHSCVLALNDDFDGGGSYVYDLERSVRPRTGGMISFPGNRCLHGGTPVTRGVRYILAIFLYRDDNLCCGHPRTGSKGSRTEKTSRDEADLGSGESSKRFKKDEGSENGRAGGGFSFSFF